MSRIFACYSLPLMKYLTLEKGIRYDIVGLNEKTNCKFWCFVKDDKLNKALDGWGLK